ncbi:MAG TPA: hypothetical protein VMG38_13125 [Trebonia sp.]|nr:hypothetical protein [Trebonia sp.]
MQVPKFGLSGSKSSAHRGKLRRAAIIVMSALSALAICTIAGGALPAQAAPAKGSPAEFAAAASPYQNKVLDAAMARVPGATRVSASEVEWGGGKVILGVSKPMTSASSLTGKVTPLTQVTPAGSGGYSNSMGNTLKCELAYFCAWGQTNEEGVCWVFINAGETGLWFDWASYSGTYCGSVGTWSWLNDTGNRVWKEQGHTGGSSGGTFWQWDGTGTGNTWCISPLVGNSNVGDTATRTMGWIQMTSNTTQCPPPPS